MELLQHNNVTLNAVILSLLVFLINFVDRVYYCTNKTKVNTSVNYVGKNKLNNDFVHHLFYINFPIVNLDSRSRGFFYVLMRYLDLSLTFIRKFSNTLGFAATS